MSALEVKRSPRFENGAYKWYYGDTFSLVFTISVTGYNAQRVISTTDNKFSINFYKENGELLYSFTDCIFATVNGGTNSVQKFSLTITFNKIISSFFAIGNYSYCIKMTYEPADSDVKENYTLLAGGKAEVELCH